MNDIIDLMKNMLKCIPNNRMNVNNLLNHLLIILLVKLLLILLTDIVKFTLICNKNNGVKRFRNKRFFNRINFKNINNNVLMVIIIMIMCQIII